MNGVKQKGFTIAELLIVIVVIAILASISVVVYAGIQARAVNANLQFDVRTAASMLELDHVKSGVYPATG